MTSFNFLKSFFRQVFDRASGGEASDLSASRVGFEGPIADLENRLLRHQIKLKWDLTHRIDSLHQPSPGLVCALCEHSAARLDFPALETHCIFGGGPIKRHQCPECDVIFGSEVMLSLTPDQLADEYEWHYRVFEEGDSTEQEVRAFYALNPDKNKKYINWGSGAWSETNEKLRGEGWEIFGYEPHGSARRLGGTVLTSVEELREVRPDGIFSNNVLEHLRHPIEELKGMARLLPSGGKMSHATPCFEYRFEFTRFHLFFFLGRSKHLIAERAGMQLVDFMVDGDFMNLVLSKK